MERIVYVERDALNYPKTREILGRLPNSRPVIADRWDDLFKRKGQNYLLQKQNPGLILAVARNGFLFRGSENCEDFGADSFYYCSQARNCLYRCQYCYLAGMYRSANLVAFVNTDDCFREVEELTGRLGVSPERPMLLPISYDSDVYALEGLYGFVEDWGKYLAANPIPGLTCEVRTKCGTRQFLDKIPVEAADNLLFTWSVTPPEHARVLEPLASPVKDRLDCAEYALDKGFRVRLSLDPVLTLGEDWRDNYARLCGDLRARGLASRVDAVGLGPFRISADYLKVMKKNLPLSPVAFDRYETRDGVTAYAPEKQTILTEAVTELLTKAGVKRERIFVQKS